MPDRRAAARFAGAVVVLGAASALLLPAGAATPKVARDIPSTIRSTITLSSLNPTAPQPGEMLRLRGTITNTSATTINNLSIELYFNAENISTRSAFEEYADTPVTDSFIDLTAEPEAHISLRHKTLAAGTAEPWAIKIPVNDLPLSQLSWEVYQLGVAAADADTTVGRLRTFLPFAPLSANSGTQPLRVGWIWPLVDSPHRDLTATGSSFINDDLAGEVAPGGRLQRLVAAASQAATQRRRANKHHLLAIRPVGVTYAIDPELIDDVAHMTAGYTVNPPGQKSVAGTGKVPAAAWLSQLRTATSENPVISLPYADPDINAAVRNKAQGIVQRATEIGADVISSDLPAADMLQGWLWPPGGLISPSALDAEFDAQTTSIVLSQAALPELIPPDYTPDAHVKVPSRDGDLTGLLVDSDLTNVVTAGASTDSGAALERYLAETLMIYAEKPAQRRSVVVAPNRDWEPRAQYADALLADTGKVPWLRSTSLTNAANAPVNAIVAPSLHYPASARHNELSSRYVDSVDSVNNEVSQLRAMTGTAGTASVATDDKAVLSALSSSWQGHAAEAGAYRSQLATAVGDTIGKVRIAAAQNSRVTLTSHTGSIPITVENGLDLPVQVKITFTADGSRLKATSAQDSYTIAAHQRRALDVRAVAQTSGVIPLYVQLRADGRAYGPPVRLYVHSTAYGTVALLITAIAFAVLLVAVIARLSRRALRARRTAGEPAGVDG